MSTKANIKYKNVYCDPPRPEATWQSLRLSTVTGEQNYIKANNKFFAIGLQVFYYFLCNYCSICDTNHTPNFHREEEGQSAYSESTNQDAQRLSSLPYVDTLLLYWISSSIPSTTIFWRPHQKIPQSNCGKFQRMG